MCVCLIPCFLLACGIAVCRSVKGQQCVSRIRCSLVVHIRLSNDIVTEETGLSLRLGRHYETLMATINVYLLNELEIQK